MGIFKMSIFDEYLACLVHDILNEMNEEKESQITPVADNADNDSQVTPIANSEENLINSDNNDLNEK
jgi:hypothetical protein